MVLVTFVPQHLNKCSALLATTVGELEPVRVISSVTVTEKFPSISGVDLGYSQAWQVLRL